MAPITRIDVYIATADLPGAGTDGAVFLGIAGREFALDTCDGDDFERGTQKTFILGQDANVTEPAYNDPRSPQLDTTDLDRYPVYLRAPDASWALDSITVNVNPGPDQQEFGNPALAAADAVLWFGTAYGEALHLTRSTA